MACFFPLVAYRAAAVNESGRRSFVFDSKHSLNGTHVKLPCGQCIGCRLERSRQWAVRVMHEASLYRDNCFVTLTYSDDFLPVGGTLVRRDVQLFIKRLRKYSVNFRGRSFRFFGCGEYGFNFGRPHYHLCLFDFNFSDRKRWSVRGGEPVYHSSILSEIWPFGNHEIGSVTFESAAYVARYCVEKVTGDAAVDHYRGRLPEFSCMSLKPGIGARWFEKFSSDVYPNDMVVVRGKVAGPPRYYDKLLEAGDADAFEAVKASREDISRDEFARRRYNRTRERLAVRFEIAASRMKQRGDGDGG